MMSGRSAGVPVVSWAPHVVRASSVALVAANLVIAATALFQEWGYYQALWIFWCEMAIIGVFNLLRMVIVGFAGSPLGSLLSPDNWAGRIVVVVVLGGFFIARFGGAVLGIGVLLLVLPSMVTHGPGPVDSKVISTWMSAVNFAR